MADIGGYMDNEKRERKIGRSQSALLAAASPFYSLPKPPIENLSTQDLGQESEHIRPNAAATSGSIQEVARSAPDWNLWADLLYASMKDAVLLSLNLDPKQASRPGERLADVGDEARRRLQIALQHAGSKNLWHSHRSTGRRDDDREVSLPKFGAFVLSLGWEIPSRFPRTLQASTPTNLEVTPPPPADSDFDPADLPLELDAANMAFRAVSNGYGDANDTFRTRLTKYLKEHYASFTNEKIDRIATVANPNKEPGRRSRKGRMPGH